MKSLDDLIRFLLEEIALCGNHGQSVIIALFLLLLPLLTLLLLLRIPQAALFGENNLSHYIMQL